MCALALALGKVNRVRKRFPLLARERKSRGEGEEERKGRERENADRYIEREKEFAAEHNGGNHRLRASSSARAIKIQHACSRRAARASDRSRRRRVIYKAISAFFRSVREREREMCREKCGVSEKRGRKGPKVGDVYAERKEENQWEK